jgi:hypothetical protein
MAVWTKNVILFFETDLLKILYVGDVQTAREQRHAVEQFSVTDLRGF